MKILLIGNSGSLSNDKGGQTTKFRLYKKKILDEGFELSVVDLERFFKTPFSILRKIKNEIKNSNRIVLISGERACKLLIPFINKCNIDNKPFVLPLVGSGVLHFSIDHLSNEDQLKFFNGDYSLGKRNRKIERELKKVTYILPETELMNKVYSEFYSLTNCVVVNNFRELETKGYDDNPNNEVFKVVYLSRIMEIKGIFDLLDVAKKIHNSGASFELDIYGDFDMEEKKKEEFYSYLSDSIKYKKSISSDEVIDTLCKYDLFVFPTRAVFEGTPGVVAESLLAGTPILSSSFPQSKYLLNNGYDSILYKMFEKEDLKEKLLWCINNKELLVKMRESAKESGQKFTYNHERGKFLKYVCGREEQ